MGAGARLAAGARGDTIVATATPPGRGGVAVVRISGAKASALAAGLGVPAPLRPRHATLATFVDDAGAPIDRGLALFFPAPASFTGEDVLELHTHGSPRVVEQLLTALTTPERARLAEPGEFTQRAFLNGKLDLAQAEAVADLIEAGTDRAARAALRALEGGLSGPVHEIASEMLALRAWLEATIDFDDEDDVNRQGHPAVSARLDDLLRQIRTLHARCTQGRALRDGLTVVLAGPPNAGKSSLLNLLADRDVAIVTDQPGTTRDALREQIEVDGLPVLIVDTAGLRDTHDPVERVGIERARDHIARADLVLYVVDAAQAPAEVAGPDVAVAHTLPPDAPVTVVRNKIDLTGEAPALHHPPLLAGSDTRLAVLNLSVRCGIGIDLLHQHLKACAGLTDSSAADAISARARHLLALAAACDGVERALHQWQASATELAAEELCLAHEALMSITGEVGTEELLGEIFSTFCIGK